MHSAKADELNNALLAISHSMADRSQLASTMHAILAAARQLTMASHGIIYVLDQTGDKLVPLAVHVNEQPLEAHPWIALDYQGLAENDPFSFALQTGEVVLINELYRYNGYDCESIYNNERLLNINSQNLIAWPLKDLQQQTVGLLVLSNLNVIDDEQSLTTFTQLAATSIRQAVLLETYHQHIQQLNNDNQALSDENRQLKQRKKPGYDGPIAESEAMQAILSRLQRILRLPVDVLLRGETGSGKEVIARHIHQSSDRAKQPFIAQNCAAIPEQLLESELFGHKKGSFTGADSDKIGLFEAANGGTLFLDEIGDMPMLLQAKLLRVLQERTIRRIGESKERHIDVRVVAATHCNILQQIKQGDFRADLYHRLNVFPVNLPPLRERQDDILPLAEHFISDVSKRMALEATPVLSQRARIQLLDYAFPGNVRELRNIIERSVLLSDFSTIETVEFGEEFELLESEPQPTQPERKAESIKVTLPELGASDDGENLSLKQAVNDYERKLIQNQLDSFGWQIKKTSEFLDMPLSTLNHKIKKYGLSQSV
ncbi:sigma-54 interaction domain-containing protein [Vibrio sp. WXL103]|uniref:sigma-54 interaction domain-containing protein n=1 Tax=unclassified Vibrio TaxID=2614977 RepID=UPI003EC6D0C1